MDCSDLHFRWNSLAMEYEDLWSNVHREDSDDQLKVLRKREAELSKSRSSFPVDDGLLSEVQDDVVMHHQETAIA